MALPAVAAAAASTIPRAAAAGTASAAGTQAARTALPSARTGGSRAASMFSPSQPPTSTPIAKSLPVAQSLPAASQGMLGAYKNDVKQAAPWMIRDIASRAEAQTRSPEAFASTWVDGWFPRFQQTVYVVVQGGPNATLFRIWQLCVSAAFGRMRFRMPGITTGATVEAHWDITEKLVSMRITYTVNGLFGSLGAGRAGASAPSIFQEGPSEETIGATYRGFLQTNQQFFNNQQAPPNNAGTITDGDPQPPEETPDPNDALRLPDNGRIITTLGRYNPHIQPPRPPENAAWGVALVSNALSSPCYLPYGPPPGHQVPLPQSEYLYDPTDLVTYNEEEFYSDPNKADDPSKPWRKEDMRNSFWQRVKELARKNFLLIYSFGNRDGYTREPEQNVPPRSDLIPLDKVNPGDK